MGFLLTYQDLILLPTFEERMEELYNNAIAAMKLYGGSEED